ncbi:MAG: hypothetical protein H0Z24_06180 [Thermosipho sp. (in: Bacteria)]|nr:hypothetical protein [Thermosipho sp. (in: thermotogales)]
MIKEIIKLLMELIETSEVSDDKKAEIIELVFSIMSELDVEIPDDIVEEIFSLDLNQKTPIILN